MYGSDDTQVTFILCICTYFTHFHFTFAHILHLVTFTTHILCAHTTYMICAHTLQLWQVAFALAAEGALLQLSGRVLEISRARPLKADAANKVYILSFLAGCGKFDFVIGYRRIHAQHKQTHTFTYKQAPNQHTRTHTHTTGGSEQQNV